MSSRSEGWKWIRPRRKWHYFIEGRSLCGTLRAMSGTFDPNANCGNDACTACQDKLNKQHKI